MQLWPIQVCEQRHVQSHMRMAYTVMACIGVTYVVMVCTVVASTLTALYSYGPVYL